jgi:glycosyltransferase involved in cell wall biosynthesis
MLPNVAIIITNYNYGEYLMDSINSALNQNYEGDLRVYVVDDGSTDDSWDKICNITEQVSFEELNEQYYCGTIEKRNSGNLYAFRINNSGASVGRNVAIWEAWRWVDIFGILDSDDEYFEDKTNQFVEKLIEHEEIGVVYGDYDNVNKLYSKREFKQSYSREKLLNNCIVHSGSLIKKTAIEKVILPNKEIFDSRLHGPAGHGFIGCTEDYDLWLRLSKVCMMTHIPNKLAIAKETGKNQSARMTPEIFRKNSEILSTRI